MEELKPFDKVLVRDSEKSVWTCDFFSYKDINDRYMCVSGLWNYCIPFEGNEDLVGSYDSPKEKRWRAEMQGTYYCIGISGEVVEGTDDRYIVDNTLYKYGNYFQTKEEAETMSEKIKKLLNERQP